MIANRKNAMASFRGPHLGRSALTTERTTANTLTLSHLTGGSRVLIDLLRVPLIPPVDTVRGSVMCSYCDNNTSMRNRHQDGDDETETSGNYLAVSATNGGER